jgi:beta-glucosidase
MSALTAEGPQPDYRDPSLPVEQRVEDLLQRMTWEEKASQLGSLWVFQLLESDAFAPAKAAEHLSNGIGHITRVSGASNLDSIEAASVANSIQAYLVNETRLGIPAIVHEEICSGLMARESTVFPQAIGVASTWEPRLAEAMADSVRAQMRAMGAHQGLSPVLDIGRDPRWGRLEETFGEDPHLVARMGVAFVRGLQGSDPSQGVIATAKHFVGYSASEGGLNWAPAKIPERELREVYLHPFEAAVAAGLQSVMNAYLELDGIPCTADRDLLTGLLRENWGFQGSVVSDYFSVRQLQSYHHLADDGETAAALAITAGIDVELPSTDCYGGPLLEAVESGVVSQGVVDEAVRRVLRAKFELGLFEQPLVEIGSVPGAPETVADRAMAREIARKSIVLLKNDGLLPLRPDLGSIAVIGPNADDARNLLGDYTYPAHIESLLEMRSKENVFSIPVTDVGALRTWTREIGTVFEELNQRSGATVRHARGCDVMGTSKEGFAEAVELAAGSDLAIMVMGDKAGLTDDCTSGEGRDRMSLDLPGAQEDLVRAVIDTGTPVVLVLVAGRPTGSAWVHENSAAVITAWLPGEEGAGAIVDVLTGEYNPGGKLPVSHPRSAGQIPVYYGHKVSGGRSHWKGDYVDAEVSPLYPFGHGLSFTTFDLQVLPSGNGEVAWDDNFEVAAHLTNSGPVEGDEVVQLYVRDPIASVTRPVLELKAFARVTLQPGESRTVRFQVPVGQLGFYDRQMEYVVEPGSVQLFIGTSSEQLSPAGEIAIVPGTTSQPPAKVFEGSVHVG